MAMLPLDMNFSPEMDANKYSEQKQSLTAQPSNGSSFKMNQPCEITVPMRQNDFVMDWQNSFLSFDITNSNATGANILHFQAYCGTIGLVNQQVVKTSTGTEFSNFSNYNVLTPLLLEQSDKDWYAGTANILFGMSDSEEPTDEAEGDSIAGAGGVIHKILPLLNTGLSKISHFPMGSIHDIVLRFKFDTVANCFIADAGDVLDSEVTLSNIVFHYDVYRLSPLALSSIDNRLVNNTYVLDTTDWVHQQYSSPLNESKYSISVGFAKKKCKRLILVSRSTDRISVTTNAGLMARNKAGITKIYCKLDGKTFQSSSGVEMTTSNPVDAYAQLLKNQGGLMDMSAKNTTYSRFNLAGAGTAPTTYATCGAFYHEIDFSNSMDTMGSSSGISIDHNNLQVFVEKTGTEAQTVDIFVEFYNQYRLPKSTGVWEVSDPVQYSQA